MVIKPKSEAPIGERMPTPSPMSKDALYVKEIEPLSVNETYKVRVSYEGSRKLNNVTYQGSGDDIRRAISEDIELGQRITAVERL